MSEFGQIGGIKRESVFGITMNEFPADDSMAQALRTTRKLVHLKLTPVQAEVLGELMNGNRTMSELTLTIYNMRYTDEKFEAYHSRIKRAVKKLERNGLISKKRLLGRNKPYGLTHHGMAKIVAITPEIGNPVVVHKWDILLFPAVILAGAFALYSLNPAATNIFSLLLEASIVRSIMIMRRIS